MFTKGDNVLVLSRRSKFIITFDHFSPPSSTRVDSNRQNDPRFYRTF